MRHRLVALALLASCTATVLFLWPPGHGEAQPPVADAAPLRPPPTVLPIQRVLLFNSGVGFFEREGPVDGDTHIDLTVPIGMPIGCRSPWLRARRSGWT